MAKNYIEDSLQIACANWLKAQEAQFNDILGFHVANERKSSPQQGARFKAKGVRAGVADLVILTDGGVTVFVELKATNGRQNENQTLFENGVTALGFLYHIIKTDSPIVATATLEHILKPYRKLNKQT